MVNKHLVLLRSTFENERNEESAEAMEKYMRGMFPFIGLRAPDRKLLSRKFIRELTFTSDENIISVMRSLWEQPERE